MQEFKVPELGESISQGDVTRILVGVGDTIARDQPVLELETDKATIEVPSSVAGIVKEIKVKQGDKVKVGAVILTVDDASTSLGTGNGAGPAAPKPAEQAKAAEKVVSMPRPPLPIGTRDSGLGTRTPDPESRIPNPERIGPAAPASPSVRRLAREIGVDVNEVHGSGPDERISQEDVKEHARRILSSVGTTVARGTGQPDASVPLPDFEKWGPIERRPMNNIRRKTAEHLSHAWTAIPHVTQFDKADITPMEELRAKFRTQVEKAGGNLTVTAVLVKVLAAAVKQFPQFNASLDAENSAIIHKKYVNVGVAVDTEYGLLVPVVRNADRKNITQIAVELHQLSEKARAKKLSLDEMSGGGISISNLGGIGGTYFTPIVNWPEVAILGVSRGVIESVFIPEGRGGSSPLDDPRGALSESRRADPPAKRPQGRFEPRQLLPLSLSYDHRVIDGADAMRFLRWVVDALEQPFLLSLLG